MIATNEDPKTAFKMNVKKGEGWISVFCTYAEAEDIRGKIHEWLIMNNATIGDERIIRTYPNKVTVYFWFEGLMNDLTLEVALRKAVA